MKKIFTTSLLLLSMIAGYAQSITGTWYGTLNISGSSLHVVFHISQNGGTYATTMDSPDQGAAGLPTDQTQFTGHQLTIEASKFALKYTGTFLPDSNKITGTFVQGTGSFPLLLTPGKSKDAMATPAKRPQDPVSFPYRQEEVNFKNIKAGNTLAGTLTLPTNGKVNKVVILISGSGLQNRNEEVTQFNHRPFLVWSDQLTKNGTAVLRYDDRGIGQSTGDFSSATSADFADDAEAAISYLKSRPGFKNISIGLMGHSEGGMIAPMVAARNKAVKFVVLLAAPGVSVSELMAQQSKDQMRLAGAPPEAIAESIAASAKLFAAMNQYQNLSSAAYKSKIDSVVYAQVRNMPKEALGGKTIEEVAQKNSQQLYSPWFRYFIAYDPAIALRKLTCPVLALNGTLDMQVQSSANLAGIKAALIKAGNKRFEVLPLSGLNHLFQKGSTGSVAEYATITETVNPVALTKVTAWINGL
jgi:pimeloyl-ACP methyl ester carboxylesterase